MCVRVQKAIRLLTTRTTATTTNERKQPLLFASFPSKSLLLRTRALCHECRVLIRSSDLYVVDQILQNSPIPQLITNRTITNQPVCLIREHSGMQTIISINHGDKLNEKSTPDYDVSIKILINFIFKFRIVRREIIIFQSVKIYY